MWDSLLRLLNWRLERMEKNLVFPQTGAPRDNSRRNCPQIRLIIDLPRRRIKAGFRCYFSLSKERLLFLFHYLKRAKPDVESSIWIWIWISKRVVLIMLRGWGCSESASYEVTQNLSLDLNRPMRFRVNRPSECAKRTAWIYTQN